MKKQMYSLIKPYKCKVCGEEMLFFKTVNNTLIDYKNFIASALSLQEMKNLIYKKNIQYLHCICCNKNYIIDWSNGWPEQLLDRKVLNKFGL